MNYYNYLTPTQQALAFIKSAEAGLYVDDNNNFVYGDLDKVNQANIDAVGGRFSSSGDYGMFNPNIAETTRRQWAIQGLTSMMEAALSGNTEFQNALRTNAHTSPYYNRVEAELNKYKEEHPGWYGFGAGVFPALRRDAIEQIATNIVAGLGKNSFGLTGDLGFTPADIKNRKDAEDYNPNLKNNFYFGDIKDNWWQYALAAGLPLGIGAMSGNTRLGLGLGLLGLLGYGAYRHFQGTGDKVETPLSVQTKPAPAAAPAATPAAVAAPASTGVNNTGASGANTSSAASTPKSSPNQVQSGITAAPPAKPVYQLGLQQQKPELKTAPWNSKYKSPAVLG